MCSMHHTPPPNKTFISKWTFPQAYMKRYIKTIMKEALKDPGSHGDFRFSAKLAGSFFQVGKATAVPMTRH